MPKILTKILCALVCVLVALGTVALLMADGAWQSAAPIPLPTPSPQIPTQEPTQPPIQEPIQTPPLPIEPIPEEPRVEVSFAEPRDFWAGCPDGIRIDTVTKRTFTAHVMYIKDPSSVYLATSSEKFSINIPGGRLPAQMEKEGAIAAINAGSFNDDGSSGVHVGALPIGMVVSEGKVLWDDGRSYNGFVGMTRDNRLYVSEKINKQTVEELGIRDGCCFGPVLINDGVPNEKVHAASVADNINSRTAIGQRADGSVVFLCIDGRQCGSIGATFDELLKIMVELECVNACALDGGASTIMAYRDTYGRYGTAGEVVTCSSYSLFQAAPRRMPTFFMVRPAEED
jgi:hypothetical protein